MIETQIIILQMKTEMGHELSQTQGGVVKALLRSMLALETYNAVKPRLHSLYRSTQTINHRPLSLFWTANDRQTGREADRQGGRNLGGMQKDRQMHRLAY